MKEKILKKDVEEKEKLWEEFCEENKEYLLIIGSQKEIVCWTYDKLLLNQIEARKEIKALKSAIQEKDKEFKQKLEQFRDKCYSLHLGKEDIILFNKFFEEFKC